ncbi:MAG: glycosyltransferase [Candidatus Latescibacteria bacterium]|nr:glycosyltransferase [Candidatus Latescibacterota bacterium]
MLTIAVVILGTLYLSLAFLFLLGTFKESAEGGEDTQPFVSIVIAAKDEQTNIGRCLDSLLAQNYPEDKFDIFVTDDCSEDCTAEIVRSYAVRFPKIRLLQAKSPPEGLSGKQHALAMGIENSAGEIILTTDANCTVPPGWVRKTVAHFSPEVGLVAGFTFLEAKGLFAKLQCLDLLYLLTIGWGATGIGKSTSAIGKNLGFRRRAYEEVGGYQGVGFTLNEDLALLGAIRDTHRWRIRFIADPSQAVTASPTETFPGFLGQRKRWTLAGLKKIPFFGQFVLVIAFCSRLLVIVLLLLSPLRAECLRLAAAVFLATSLSDFLILLRSVIRLKRGDLLRYLPLIFPFQLLYQSIIGTSVLLGRRQLCWKGRKYDGHLV